MCASVPVGRAMPRYFYPASYTISHAIGPRVAPACLRGSTVRGAPLIVFSSPPEAALVPGSYHVIISANATAGPTLDALYFYLRRTGVLTAADRRRAVALALTTASSISVHVQAKARIVFVSNTPESLAAGA